MENRKKGLLKSLGWFENNVHDKEFSFNYLVSKYTIVMKSGCSNINETEIN